MKTTYLMLGLILSSFLFQGCNDDDNNHHSGNKIIDDAFAIKYPKATHIDWEKKGNYSVVDFRYNNKELEAWFDQNGIWHMTETDLAFNSLPETVISSFSSSEYKSWSIDDVDMVERKDMETIYVLEIEQNKQEYDLYYSPDGVLIKVIPDNDNNSNYLPNALADAITSYISTHYPQARIVETEKEKEMTEVDIIDGTIHRELMFDSNGNWVHTKTRMQKTMIPQIVISALEASEYASYTIDEVEYYETPLRNYYYFELDSNSKEVELIITTEGMIEVVKVENDR